MLKDSRNVYIVNNFKSNNFEQAIFILKPGFSVTKNNSAEIANEAEKIINNYISKLEFEKNNFSNKNKLTFKKTFFVCAFAFLLTMFYIFLLNLFK